MPEDFMEEVIYILNNLGYDVSDIEMNRDTNLIDDVGLDSNDIIEFIIEFEEEFEVEINVESTSIKNWETIEAYWEVVYG